MSLPVWVSGFRTLGHMVAASLGCGAGGVQLGSAWSFCVVVSSGL